MKAAIQLGVKDYLLKPVVRSELTALLGKLATELEEDSNRIREQDQEDIKNHQQLGVMQEQLLWQLVKDEWFSVSTMKERMDQLQLSALAVDDVHAQFVTVEMRIPPGRLDDWSERKDLLYLAFQMLCRESAQKWEHIYPFYSMSHPAMIHFVILVQNAEYERFLADFVRKLKRDIQTYLKVDCVLGIGEPIHGLRQLKDGYASSMLAWSQATIHSDKAETDRNMLAMTHRFSTEVERKLMQTIENLDMSAFTKQLHSIFSADRDTPMFVFTF